MDQTTAKSQAAGAGAGLSAIVVTAVTAWIFSQWPELVGAPWESVISGAVGALVGAGFAAYAAWQTRNKMTAGQITTAIEKGDVSPGAVATVARTTTPTPISGA